MHHNQLIFSQEKHTFKSIFSQKSILNQTTFSNTITVFLTVHLLISYKFSLFHRSTIMYMRTTTPGSVWTRYTIHMTQTSWLTFIFVLGVIMLFLKLIGQITQNSDQFSFSDCFLIVIGSFSGNGELLPYPLCEI